MQDTTGGGHSVRWVLKALNNLFEHRKPTSPPTPPLTLASVSCLQQGTGR